MGERRIHLLSGGPGVVYCRPAPRPWAHPPETTRLLDDATCRACLRSAIRLAEQHVRLLEWRLVDLDGVSAVASFNRGSGRRRSTL